MSTRTYFGPRLRRLRRELGLTQAQMAADLDISASYVALMERNTRPVTADMLLRLAARYRLDLAELAPSDRDDHRARLARVLTDPLFADCDVDPLEAEDVVTNFPGVTDALLRLHTAWVEAGHALAENRTVDGGADPVAAAEAFLAARRHHFADLDRAAERLADEIGRGEAALTARLGERHGLRVRHLPDEVMGGSRRRLHRHHDQLLLNERLSPADRLFEIAVQIAYLELDGEIAAAGGGTGEGDAAVLIRTALADYAAGAIRMPYSAMVDSAGRLRHDVDALAHRFGTSWEQTARRLTTLGRPGREGVPFLLIEMDGAAAVTWRLDGTGLAAARAVGPCPRWCIHDAPDRADGPRVEVAELPDGQRLLSVTRAVMDGGGAYGAATVRRTVTLCCAIEHADRLVYGDHTGPVTPIGTTCRLCQRTACPARAQPPIGRALMNQDSHRPGHPYLLAEG